MIDVDDACVEGGDGVAGVGAMGRSRRRGCVAVDATSDRLLDVVRVETMQTLRLRGGEGDAGQGGGRSR